MMTESQLFGMLLEETAKNIDDLKPPMTDVLHAKTAKCIEQMHDLAKELLGEHAKEFYDQEDVCLAEAG